MGKSQFHVISYQLPSSGKNIFLLWFSYTGYAPTELNINRPDIACNWLSGIWLVQTPDIWIRLVDNLISGPASGQLDISPDIQ